ncbi:MAG: hypothetical protein WD181_04180 [Solirubrobacterales bacterium]
MTSAIGASEFGLVLLLTILIVVPIAGVAFARSGKALEQLGKGRFSIDRDDDLGSETATTDSAELAEQERTEEVRQMIEAADFRSRARGEGRVDVEREIERLMAGEGLAETPPTAPSAAGEAGEVADSDPQAHESGMRAEVRQLVIANNERRARRGEEPLDVESEVDRRLKEWG